MITPVPSKRALEFLKDEFGVFFHFGIRTFNEENRDWDGLPMELSTFNPTALDCGQWIKAIKKAGARYAVLTTKHHDGFTLWPSSFTAFSVKNTPWKNGQGDVVREFVDACRENGIKPGLYYSCAQFDTKDMTSERYNDFVAGQLEELFGGSYGDISIIWFDGCGSEGFNFDSDRFEKMLREMQPGAMINGAWGKDFKWVGNEWGHAQLDNTGNIVFRGEDKFAPVECDACLTRRTPENFWFYNETNKGYTRTVDELVGMYYLSIGRGANLLLNIAPDRRGLLPEESMELIYAAKAELDRRFTECVLPASKPIEVSVTESGKKRFTLELDRPLLADEIILTENLESGEHIRRFTAYSFPYPTKDSERKGEIGLFYGGSVGNKRIITFPTIRTRIIDIVLDDADDEAQITGITALYVGDRSGKQILG